MKKFLMVLFFSSNAYSMSAIVCETGYVKDGKGFEEIVGRLNQKINQPKFLFSKQVHVGNGKFEESTELMVAKSISSPTLFERVVTSSLKSVTMCVSVNGEKFNF